MPLDADHPAFLGRLESLDQLIHLGRYLQARPEDGFGHRLVVPRVDRERPPAGRRGKPGTGSRHDSLMLDDAAGLRRPMIPDILDKLSTEGDVEHLEAAADPEHRQVGLNHAAGERKLQLVTLGVDLVRGRVRLAIACRVDVAAASQQQPVYFSRHLVTRVDLEDFGPRAFERLAVQPVRSDPVGRRSGEGQSDARPQGRRSFPRRSAR
jgi:hypothetical protein